MSSFPSSILLTFTWYIILLFFKVAQRWKVKRERLRQRWKGSKWGAKRIKRPEIIFFSLFFSFLRINFIRKSFFRNALWRNLKRNRWLQKSVFKGLKLFLGLQCNWTLIFLYFQVIWIGYGRHQCDTNHLWRDLNSMVSINVHLKKDTHWEPDLFMINWDSNRIKLRQLFPGGRGTAVVEMEQLIFFLEVQFQKEICIPREQKFIDIIFSAVTIIW